MTINICMVGSGMMATWHSETLALIPDVYLHTVVSRLPFTAEEFAKKYKYKRFLTSLDAVCSDPEIDAVILATPDDLHEDQAIAVLNSNKHLLLETPIAMSLSGTLRVLEYAKNTPKVFSVCHQMRFSKKDNIYTRVLNKEEEIKHISIRYYNNKIININALGNIRNWRDTILWHHFCHFVDLGIWLLNNPTLSNIQSYLAPIDKTTGIPMYSKLFIETDDKRTLLIEGHYGSSYRMFEELIVTNKDTYLFDITNQTLKTSKGLFSIESEKINIAKTVINFILSIRDKKDPFINPNSLVPTMAILQKIQDSWS